MKKRICQILVVALMGILVAVPVLAADGFNFTANVQKVELTNGLTLLLKENPAFDIIAVVVMSRVGTAQDPAGLEGLTYLAQRNLLSGTASRSALELVTELESLGTRLYTNAGYDYAGVFMETLPDNFSASFQIVLDVLTSSTFPEPEFERERALSLAALQSLADDPTNALVIAYQEIFYGDHPYKFTPYGSFEGLSVAQPAQVRDWQRYIYSPENVTVAVVGNFNTAELLPTLEAYLGSWQANYTPELTPKEMTQFVYPAEERELAINLPTEAAFVLIGYPAPDTFDPDSAVMQLINTVLGSGASSRLFTEIREKRGMAYGTGSVYDERLGPSNLLTIAATHPSLAEAVKEQILHEVNRFAQEGLSEEEIAWVATRLRGQYLLQNETNLNQAYLLATAEMMGRGYAWVDEYMHFFDNVQPEDVKRVAEQYLKHYTGVILGP